MATFIGKDGSKKFSMNPQVGKAMNAPAPAAADVPPAGLGLESPAEESAEPQMVSCPDCGKQFQINVTPVDQPSEVDPTAASESDQPVDDGAEY